MSIGRCECCGMFCQQSDVDKTKPECQSDKTCRDVCMVYHHAESVTNCASIDSLIFLDKKKGKGT